MTHGEKVGTLFLEGYNCAQSVVLAFADEMGIPKETAARIASSFGGVKEYYVTKDGDQVIE